LKGLC